MHSASVCGIDIKYGEFNGIGTYKILKESPVLVVVPSSCGKKERLYRYFGAGLYDGVNYRLARIIYRYFGINCRFGYGFIFDFVAYLSGIIDNRIYGLSLICEHNLGRNRKCNHS